MDSSYVKLKIHAYTPPVVDKAIGLLIGNPPLADLAWLRPIALTATMVNSNSEQDPAMLSLVKKNAVSFASIAVSAISVLLLGDLTVMA